VFPKYFHLNNSQIRSENYVVLYCKVFPVLPLLLISSIKPSNCGSIPRNGERFYLLLNVRRGSNAYLPSRSIGTEKHHPGIRRPEHEAYYSTSPSFKVTVVCRYKSIRLCAYETRARTAWHWTLQFMSKCCYQLPVTRSELTVC
jgi:hypothetical protein